MAAPNVVNVTSIFGKTVGYEATTSLASTGVENAANSGKVFKVNTVTCANLAATTVTVSLSLYKGGSTHFYITKNVVIPPGATLVAVNKESPIYLEEGDSLHTICSASASAHAIISYEEIG